MNEPRLIPARWPATRLVEIKFLNKNCRLRRCFFVVFFGVVLWVVFVVVFMFVSLFVLLFWVFFGRVSVSMDKI